MIKALARYAEANAAFAKGAETMHNEDEIEGAREI
jgi:hypothetical protein